MKKILLINLILVKFLLGAEIHIKTALDIPTKLVWKSENKLIGETKEEEIFIFPSFDIQADYFYKLNKKLELGFGLAYEGELIATVDYETIGYNSIPYYLAIKYNVKEKKEDKLYILAKLGKSFIKVNNEDIDKYYNSNKGGLYANITIGLESDKIIRELFYSTSNTEFSSEQLKESYNYSKIGISFGRKFSF